MRGTRRQRKRQQFPNRDSDQKRWRAWFISNRLKNAKCKRPFLRQQDAVERFPPEIADVAHLLAATIGCVGNFHKAKELDAHILCGTWCRIVTDFWRKSARILDAVSPTSNARELTDFDWCARMQARYWAVDEARDLREQRRAERAVQPTIPCRLRVSINSARKPRPRAWAGERLVVHPVSGAS